MQGQGSGFGVVGWSTRLGQGWGRAGGVQGARVDKLLENMPQCGLERQVSSRST